MDYNRHIKIASICETWKTLPGTKNTWNYTILCRGVNKIAHSGVIQWTYKTDYTDSLL